MIHLEDATIEHLQERYDQLEAFNEENAEKWGGATFPIHDDYSGDDPDAEWNSMAEIDAELGRRW